MNYTSYDTTVKHLVRLDLENIIPDKLLRTIPNSNLYRWKNENNSKYVGTDLNEIAKQKYQLLLDVSRSNKAQKILGCYFQLIKTCQTVIGLSSSVKKVFHASKSEIVDCIQKVKPVLGLKKALHFFNISSATFYNWLLETKVKCIHNFFFVCNRLRPNQLTKSEVIILKNLVLDEKYKFWPVSSIAWYARRNNILNVGLSTFYKYTKLLGISRPKFSKPKPETGIRASCPNQWWHADITEFTINGIKYYLYFLMDNYSRFILSWHVSLKKSGIIWKQVLKNAIAKYKPEMAKLLVDDGSENNNRYIDDLLKLCPNLLQKLIAQKDVRFSNSMVEAINKIMKNDYLRAMGINSQDQLSECVAFSVNDYNTIRPHNSLKGSTPKEAFYTILWDRSVLVNQTLLAKAERLAENRKNTCKKCW